MLCCISCSVSPLGSLAFAEPFLLWLLAVSRVFEVAAHTFSQTFFFVVPYDYLLG